MQMALGLARRGLGSTWPNPSVGCVIVDQAGYVIGRGYTGEGGRPHGETIALVQAGQAAQGAVVYVTLEPCSHHGKTPPCADALIAAEVSRVVVATGDPDKRVSGRGLGLLEKAGIQVDFGICQSEADRLNQGFFSRCTKKRPLLTLKVASSQDGMIARTAGQKSWVTGPESRQRGHLLRADHDAILVGIGTVLADNPSLDCRLPGLSHRSPIRVVIDSHLRIPKDCKLVKTAQEIPTWVITTLTTGEKIDALARSGVRVLSCPANSQGRVDLGEMLIRLGAEGITRILSEGGAEVNASLIRASLVDRLYWFRSMDVIGDGGLSALASIELTELLERPNFHLVRTGRTGKDVWQEFEIGP